MNSFADLHPTCEMSVGVCYMTDEQHNTNKHTSMCTSTRKVIITAVLQTKNKSNTARTVKMVKRLTWLGIMHYHLA